MESHDHNHNANFPSTLLTVYHELQNKHPKAISGISITSSGSNFLAARHALANNLDTTHFRTSVASLLGLETDFRILQIVGDSATPFSSDGIPKISEIIREAITPGTVLEYGYTAGQHDTNWIVNDLISADPDLARRSIANVVYEAARAVSEWGCEATGYIGNFVLAYDENGQTRFGDDLFLSDGIMKREFEDEMICAEGGVQAFEQVVGVMERGVSVTAVTGNVRKVMSTSKFSAAALLKGCADALRDGRETDEVMVELLNDLKNRRVFEGKPDLYSRIAGNLKRAMIYPSRIKDIQFVVMK